jgi:hypothetical protein
MENSRKFNLVMVAIALMLETVGASAQEQDQGKDSTGTNPINFTRDIRAYTDFSKLNTEGDGTQSAATVEFRTPFAEGKWQWRLRVRYISSKADLNDDGHDDVDESGLGDSDMRFLTILKFDKETKTAWAGGLEVFMNTGEDEALGAGSTSLGPQLFYVKFLPTGLFAPALQYRFSVDEDDGRDEVDEWVLDLNYLRMAKDKKSWFFADPKLFYDNKNDEKFSVVDLEWGWMMANWFEDMAGQSFYLRPSIGLGADRPIDGAIEVGYKIVGW